MICFFLHNSYGKISVIHVVAEVVHDAVCAAIHACDDDTHQRSNVQLLIFQHVYLSFCCTYTYFLFFYFNLNFLFQKKIVTSRKYRAVCICIYKKGATLCLRDG